MPPQALGRAARLKHRRVHPCFATSLFENIQAGVSAGSVVVALLAVGCDADELFQLVMSMPFHKLAQPEIGALMRAGGNILLTLLQWMPGGRGSRGWAKLHSLSKA